MGERRATAAAVAIQSMKKVELAWNETHNLRSGPLSICSFWEVVKGIPSEEAADMISDIVTHLSKRAGEVDPVQVCTMGMLFLMSLFSFSVKEQAAPLLEHAICMNIEAYESFVNTYREVLEEAEDVLKEKCPMLTASLARHGLGETY